MLNLLPTQPAEPLAQHDAMATLARFRTRLENCPNDKRGDWHEAATTAWAAMLQIEQMVSQLLRISGVAPSQDASDAIDHAINVLVESAGTMTSEAERRAKDDAVNGAFNREIDNWNMRRGGAE
jgi:Holliday junction resolvasome RuvABC endonuclease subunit